MDKVSKEFREALKALVTSVVSEHEIKEMHGDSYSGPDSDFADELEAVDRSLRKVIQQEIKKATNG